MSKSTPFDRRIVLDWLQWGKFPEANNAPQIALDYIGELERKLAEKDVIISRAESAESRMILLNQKQIVELEKQQAIIERLKEQRNTWLKIAIEGNDEFSFKRSTENMDAELAELEKGDKV